MCAKTRPIPDRNTAFSPFTMRFKKSILNPSDMLKLSNGSSGFPKYILWCSHSIPHPTPFKQ